VVILPLILNGLLPLWDFGVVTGFFPPVNLPNWLLAASSANSALLNLRLLRILKFQRVLTDETTYMNFELALGMKKSEVRPYQLQLARVVISIFTLVSVSTGLIYSAEHDVNPQIPDYFTALYFGLTTLTTVGFGDISPITVSGRFVVGASILAGVAIIPAQAASLAEAYLDFMKERASSSSSSSSSSSGGVSRAVAKPSTNAARMPSERIKDATTTTTTATRSSNSAIETRSETTCSACSAGSHRVDARFCWSCGKNLE
jgi:voltage-gated potassium channel Kch